MKKAILTMTLFLLVCIATNAQNYTIKKQVVGTGGFVGKQVGTNKIYGIFGQPVTGVLNPTVDGRPTTMFIGFWAFPPMETSIEEEMIAAKGVINFPNPVTNFTSFKFNLKDDSYVTLNVYNNIGVLVATVTQNSFYAAGQNTIDWDLNNSQNRELSSGSYMYEVLVMPMNGRTSNTYSFRNILMIAK